MNHGRQVPQQVQAVLYSEGLPLCWGVFDDVYRKLLQPYIKELISYRSPAPAWKSTRCIEFYSSLKLNFSEVQQPTTSFKYRRKKKNPQHNNRKNGREEHQSQEPDLSMLFIILIVIAGDALLRNAVNARATLLDCQNRASNLRALCSHSSGRLSHYAQHNLKLI